MKKCAGIFTLCFISILANAQLKLISPDKAIEVSIQTGKEVTYAVHLKGQPLVLPSVINLVVNGEPAMLTNAKVKRVQRQSVQNTIISPVPEKRKSIPDVYNE